MIGRWNGENSVVLRHEAEERRRDRLEAQAEAEARDREAIEAEDIAGEQNPQVAGNLFPKEDQCPRK